MVAHLLRALENTTIHIPELRHLDLSLPALYMTQVLYFLTLPTLGDLIVDHSSDSYHATGLRTEHQI